MEATAPVYGQFREFQKFSYVFGSTPPWLGRLQSIMHEGGVLLSNIQLLAKEEAHHQHSIRPLRKALESVSKGVHGILYHAHLRLLKKDSERRMDQGEGSNRQGSGRLLRSYQASSAS